MIMTAHGLSIRFPEGILEQLAVKLKSEGLNPQSKTDIVLFALEKYLTGASVQQAKQEDKLLSSLDRQGSESSGSITRESPTEAPEPAKIGIQDTGIVYTSSGYPIHPSRLKIPFVASHTGKTDLQNWQKPSTVTSKPMKSSITTGSQTFNDGQQNQTTETMQSVELTLKQKQSLLYHEIREEQKRETARQTKIRRPQREIKDDRIAKPFGPCPLGHKPNYCANNLCDRRGQCNAPNSGIQTINNILHGENPEPFQLDYVR